VTDRRDYIPAAEIVREVDEYVCTHRHTDIDWVTFVGSGEPTLHSRLGWMILKLKGLTSIPVAVITNGSLLYQAQVREELSVADAVLPSLDAGTTSLYRVVNRPHPVCTFERLIEGLIEFRAHYEGKLWVETMLVKGLNDTDDALKRMAAVLSRVQPDEIHVSSPTRPPAEAWVEPPGREGLERATAILGPTARVAGVAPGDFDLSGFDNPTQAVIAIISRHPIDEQELIRTLHSWTPGEITDVLARLIADGDAQVVNRHGKRFWSSARARYQHQLTRVSTGTARL
jgi:wyosine [tRNA(Phe)-imidazoG37] synthetase (radical SAM superfamily)